MNIPDLDYAELEARYWASKVHSLMNDAIGVYFSSGRCHGKSRLTQMYMEHAYTDLVRQGKTILVAHGAKVTSITLDEIQQPMKRIGQPLTLDDFRKAPVGIQVGMALAKTNVCTS